MIITLCSTHTRYPHIRPTLDSLPPLAEGSNPGTVVIMTYPRDDWKDAKLMSGVHYVAKPEVPSRRYLGPISHDCNLVCDDDMIYSERTWRSLCEYVRVNPRAVFQAGGYVHNVKRNPQTGKRYVAYRYEERNHCTTDIIQPGCMVAFAPYVYSELQTRLLSQPDVWDPKSDFATSDDYTASRELDRMGIPRIVCPELGRWQATALDEWPDQLHNRGDGNMRKFQRILAKDSHLWPCDYPYPVVLPSS